MSMDIFGTGLVNTGNLTINRSVFLPLPFMAILLLSGCSGQVQQPPSVSYSHDNITIQDSPDIEPNTPVGRAVEMMESSSPELMTSENTENNNPQQVGESVTVPLSSLKGTVSSRKVPLPPDTLRTQTANPDGAFRKRSHVKPEMTEKSDPNAPISQSAYFFPAGYKPPASHHPENGHLPSRKQVGANSHVSQPVHRLVNSNSGAVYMFLD